MTEELIKALEEENGALHYKDQINVRLLKHKSEQIAGLQRVLSQWQKDVEWIDIPDCLRKQAGSEIDMNNKRSD